MMPPVKHLDPQVTQEVKPGIWVPAIAEPLYSYRFFFFPIYTCVVCSEKFTKFGDYLLHYRTEQLLEEHTNLQKYATSGDLSRIKALFWRRAYFVLEHGTKRDVEALRALRTPEMMTAAEVTGLVGQLEDIWGPVFRKYSEKNDITVGHVVDEITIEDEDPSEAAKDLDYFSHTNSKGVTYFLHMKTVTLRGGKPHPIYYFKRAIDPKEAVKKEAFPANKRVRENPRNGFLSITSAKETSEDED